MRTAVYGVKLEEKFISKKNLDFLLYEVFDVLSLTGYDYYRDHDRETFDIILDTAHSMAQNIFRPVLEEMDRNPPELIDGNVKVHPAVRTIMKEFGDGGWIGSSFPESAGGSQLPVTINNICYFIFSAANYSAGVYPVLTTGAAGLIISFGDKNLNETYIPKMLSGEWQGTMALTEPQAGSSLADITATAEPADGGWYNIRGRKLFTSAGDHDGVENIVHLMLAKIKGAPAGIKGISLFVVPKKRINDDGSLVSNDIVTSEIYHKLGYRGAPITGLSIGENNDCRGYLVGKPHNGLFYMFQMMNEARLGVGCGAAAIASAAFYASLEYTKERCQGRSITAKDPALPQVPIIEHADVKRMLLFQRDVVEGSLSLLTQCSIYADLTKALDGLEKEKYELLLDILTPIAKSYPSEMGVLSVSQAVQCFGGYGYCDDFPVEQYYRDVRIHPIHEGTTGIHGMDLLGRKVIMHGGKAFDLYLDELGEAIEEAREITDLAPFAQKLDDAVVKLKKVTSLLLSLAEKNGPEYLLADATVYLELFGIVTVAWQWLIQGTAAQKAMQDNGSISGTDFYMSKLYTMRYFFGYELPKILGLSSTLTNSDALTCETHEKLFYD